MLVPLRWRRSPRSCARRRIADRGSYVAAVGAARELLGFHVVLVCEEQAESARVNTEWLYESVGDPLVRLMHMKPDEHLLKHIKFVGQLVAQDQLDDFAL